MALHVRLAPFDAQLMGEHLQAGTEPILARLLAARSITPQELLALVEDPLVPSPDEIPGLAQLAQEVREFLDGGGRLAVHGDYDVDGVSGTAIALAAIEQIGFTARAVLPHRLKDGYGLSAATVDRLNGSGIGGILTVDCGVSSVEAAQRARELGMRLWITDHHALPAILPDALMAHPGVLPERHPLRSLSGAGMALQLARAWLGEEADALLDLATLGTLADQVPLLGANRSIVRRGLRMLARAPRPGIAALLAVARHQGEIDEEAIAFLVAPRLNACGRIDTPDLALSILRSDLDGALALARHADELNRQRQSIERDVLDAARSQAARGSCAFAAGEGWHRGVVGIVAARLVEETGKPAFVLGIDGEQAHGSARTPVGTPLLEALRANAALLESFGGHAGAAGFHLASDRLEALRDGLQAFYADCAPQAAAVPADGRLRLGEAALAGVEALSRLRPYGAGLPAPVWLVEDAQVIEDRAIGDGRHRLMRLRDATGVSSAVHWRGGPAPGARLDVVAALEENAFRGQRSARLRIIASAPSARALLHEAAARPPLARAEGAPLEIVDRRGSGPPERIEPCQYFTLDTLTIARATEAFGEGYFPAAPGAEKEILELYESGRLRGLVGPHAVAGVPLHEVIALERPAEPAELRAVADGRRLVLAYGRDQEAVLQRQAAAWALSDEALRDAFRTMRKMPRERLLAQPEDDGLALAWHVFRELGLLTGEGLREQPASLGDSQLLASFRRRAARFEETAALFYGPIGALQAALCAVQEDAAAR
ncbi:MAG: DHHA1 domain-containing protein [Thermaerobacter sp.]|nr:DHHA1 domain-containing protein [Thermaerobacter sp.]